MIGTWSKRRVKASMPMICEVCGNVDESEETTDYLHVCAGCVAERTHADYNMGSVKKRD
jgi:hypothetical protein